MRVLLVGSGGREHALAWALARSPSLTELHAARGNPGIADLAHCHPVAESDGEALAGLAHAHAIDLVVVGPEAPLVEGVADTLRRQGIAVFGPGAAAARIEGRWVVQDSLRDSSGPGQNLTPLAFGLGGLAAAAVGALADHVGIVAMFKFCAWLPALGLLTFMLPRTSSSE